MTIANVMMDTARPVGEKLDSEMQAEIEELAPGIPPDGTITEAKLGLHAVTTDKIAPGAVGSAQVGNGALEAVNYAPDSVDTNAIAPGAVTATEAGTGVMTAHDAAGNPITLDAILITAAAYAALPGGPNPNKAYLIY